MGKTSKKWSKYIKIAIVLLILILCYLLIPMNQNNYYSNAYKVRSNGVGSDPIKLQFRNGFQHDHYKPPKKSTFMQKRMEDNEEGKKPIFWNKKDD
jgi:hypothetical protein